MATGKKSTGKKAASAGAKTGTKKAATKKAAGAGSPKGGAATKKAAPAAIKLSDRQREFLQKVHEAGEAGFEIGQKTDQRTIDALVDRKLVKRGAKNKESGKHRYSLSKMGQKHLDQPTPKPGT